MFILKTCCFTGHRPTLLSRGGERYDVIYQNLREVLKIQITVAVLSGYKHFISGMAMGIDQIAAEIVLEMKAEYPDLILECALPCTSQSERWAGQDELRYHNVLEKADRITYVNFHYYPGCFADRNHYMVDHSDMIIAIFNGTKRSGTYQTINYAMKQGRKVMLIDPHTLHATLAQQNTEH